MFDAAAFEADLHEEIKRFTEDPAMQAIFAEASAIHQKKLRRIKLVMAGSAVAVVSAAVIIKKTLDAQTETPTEF